MVVGFWTVLKYALTIKTTDDFCNMQLCVIIAVQNR